MDETETDIIKKGLYDYGTFSNSYLAFLVEKGFAREHSKKSAPDYSGYTRGRRIGANSGNADGNGRLQQNGSGTLAETG